MSTKFKKILLTVVAAGFIFSSATAFAIKLVPGTTEPCEQLWLVNDPGNAYLDADAGGECIDVPVNMKKVKVLFNLDNAVIQNKPIKDAGGNVIIEKNPVGLRHMALLGKVMQYRISQGLIEPSNIEIVGIFHGPAMSQERWPFKLGTPGGSMPDYVKVWVDRIFALKNAGINIQLEVCGVTLKGMQTTMKNVFDAPAQAWSKMDERAIYSNTAADAGPDGRILVNQGAVGRIIELQMNGFAYLQEE